MSLSQVAPGKKVTFFWDTVYSIRLFYSFDSYIILLFSSLEKLQSNSKTRQMRVRAITTYPDLPSQVCSFYWREKKFKNKIDFIELYFKVE